MSYIAVSREALSTPPVRSVGSHLEQIRLVADRDRELEPVLVLRVEVDVLRLPQVDARQQFLALAVLPAVATNAAVSISSTTPVDTKPPPPPCVHPHLVIRQVVRGRLKVPALPPPLAGLLAQITCTIRPP